MSPMLRFEIYLLTLLTCWPSDAVLFSLLATLSTQAKLWDFLLSQIFLICIIIVVVGMLEVSGFNYHYFCWLTFTRT